VEAFEAPWWVRVSPPPMRMPRSSRRKQGSYSCDLTGETRVTYVKHSENKAVINKYIVDFGGNF
jgi:hypothetical protein